LRPRVLCFRRMTAYSDAMRDVTEREAIDDFLNAYAEMAPVERRCRRVETVAIVTNTAGIIALTVTPALNGYGALDLASYLAACVLALTLRACILDGAARRRNWAIMEIGRLHALARLAYLDENRSRDRRTPDRTAA
jgi:hypothetical protein